MKKSHEIIGRREEIRKLDILMKSKKSEFAVVYGRRRVGKTFLIREYFDNKFDLYVSGMANADTSQQLFNFHNALTRQSNQAFPAMPKNWIEAFGRLIDYLETKTNTRKKILFFDEMPWFDTARSDFMMGLEHFWNSWASSRKDIILIGCGSAASWMINELINNHGGLHNRITQRIKLMPFTIHETEELLVANNCVFDRYQIMELYMVLGGIPYYLEAIESGKSVAQNIEDLCFIEGGLLRNEFTNLYRSLFRKFENHEKLVEALSKRTIGLQRNEIINISGIPSGGTLTKTLQELEESGFISVYKSLDNKITKSFYRLSDYYTSFYLKFIKNAHYSGKGSWTNLIDNPLHRAWQGFTFEQVCIDHILQIKKALGISGILTRSASWRGEIDGKGAQIDLVIERRDHVINICEMKFSIDSFTINKDYAAKLRKKIDVFKKVTKTKYSVFLTMITTYGIDNNQYAKSLVQNDITMEDLFA